MAQTVVTVTFRTNAREQVRAARAVIIRQPSGWFLHALFLGIPVALMFYLAFFDPDVRPWNWWFALGLLAWCSGFLYLFPWIPVRSVRKGQRDADGPFTVTIADDGLRLAAPHSTTDFRWDAVAKSLENGEFLFVYTGRNVAFALPKRSFQGDELASARALLAKYTSGP